MKDLNTIIGHAEIIRRFDRLIANDQLAHAYLFVGPEHVGKGTMAQRIAMQLLCGASRDRPCSSCDFCSHVARGTHPDVIRTTEQTSMGIDDVRSWSSALAQSSLFNGWRLGMLERVDCCTPEAANACLKTIEEPGAKTLLLLTAPDVRLVLPTIVSRCAIVRFRRVPEETIAAALVGRGVRERAAHHLAGLADGCPGRAISFVRDDARREAYEHDATLARALVVGSACDRLRIVDAFAKRFSDDLPTARQSALGLIGALRMVARAKLQDAVMMERREVLWHTVQWLRSIERAPADIAANVNPRLVLEAIALTAPG